MSDNKANMIFTEYYTCTVKTNGNPPQVKWEKNSGDTVYARMEGVSTDANSYYVETEYGTYTPVPKNALMPYP